MNRREFLTKTISAVVAAPVIARAESLMNVSGLTFLDRPVFSLEFRQEYSVAHDATWFNFVATNTKLMRQYYVNFAEYDGTLSADKYYAKTALLREIAKEFPHARIIETEALRNP